MELKQVIVVRTDLGMSRGKIAAQAAHASLTAALEAMRSKRQWFDRWLEEGQKKVVLQVGSEEELLSVYRRAAEAGLPAALVADRGLTELKPGTKTAVAVGPAPASEIDKITGSLKLLR